MHLQSSIDRGLRRKKSMRTYLICLWSYIRTSRAASRFWAIKQRRRLRKRSKRATMARRNSYLSRATLIRSERHFSFSLRPCLGTTMSWKRSRRSLCGTRIANLWDKRRSTRITIKTRITRIKTSWRPTKIRRLSLTSKASWGCLRLLACSNDLLWGTSLWKTRWKSRCLRKKR